MKDLWIIFLLLGAGAVGLIAAGYEFKDIQALPASEYASHQDFQGITIGARAYLTEQEVLEIFDTKRLHLTKIMAVLLVVENRNDFALGLYSSDIFLLTPDGTNIPPLPTEEVLLRISMKKDMSSYTPKQLSKLIKEDLRLDFERKSFGDRLIDPESSDYGVVFFETPEELSDLRLYFPEIINMTTEEPLVFFEFPLEIEKAAGN